MSYLNYRCPECGHDGVTFSDSRIKCLSCGYYEPLYDYRNAYDDYPREDTSHIDIEDRLNDLESMSAERGSIPRMFSDELKSIKADVIHLRRKIAAKPVIKKGNAIEVDNRTDITDRLYK